MQIETYNPTSDNIQTYMRHICATLYDMNPAPDVQWLDAGYCLDAPEFIPAGFTSKNKSGTTCGYVVRRG